MSNNKLTFGTGRKCITPEVPVSLAGYFNTRMFDKVLDNIYVHVLLLSQGDSNTGIIYLELIAVPSMLQEYLYKEISKKYPLTQENLVICASHTHTAPNFRKNATEHSEDYMSFMVQKTLEAVDDAWNNMSSGELCLGRASDDRFAFNRRYWMKDGSVVTNPGKLNPDIDRPEGDIDPEIPLIGIKKDGALRVLISNISNHGDTIGGNGVSGDWMGFCRRKLENEMGQGSMSLPLIAPSGNINHFNVSSSAQQTSYAEAARIGNGYADTIIAALPELKYDSVTLQAFNKKIEVGARQLSVEELEEARATLKKYPLPDLNSSASDLTSEDLANRTPAALAFFAAGTIKVAEDKAQRIFNIVCIDFGNACIVSLPSEVFVETGLAIRKSCPEKIIMLATHSGSGATHLMGGYIPNIWNYGRGGYETTPRSNPFDINTANKLVTECKSLIAGTIKKD